VSAALRPPAGLSAAAFFETWLKEAFAASGSAGVADAPVVRVTLSGPGGGDWQVQAAEDGLVVEALAPGPRGNDGVRVWLRQSAADFAAVFDPGPDLPTLLPATWTALDLLFLDQRDVALLEQMAGRIAIEVLGKRRRRWAMDLSFDKEGLSAGRPRATVQIDGATYDGLRTKAIAPMQALLGGKVKVDGDRALATKALMLVWARLAR
jgi:hypothetical protein